MNIESTERETILHNKKIIRALVESEPFIEGPYTTSGGAKLPVAGYIERIFAQPQYYRVVIKEMAKYLKRLKMDSIMACQMVGIPFADSIAYELRIPFCPIRKEKSEHGVITNLVGTVPDDAKNIVLFDDWNGSWTSLKKYYQIVREYGIKPNHIVSIVDSFEDEASRKNVSDFLEQEYLHFTAFCTFRDIIDEYLRQGKINQELYNILGDFLANPATYLADSANIEKFITLKNEGKTTGLKPKTIVEKKFEIR